MGLLNNLFQKLFGKPIEAKNTSQATQVENYMERWERERQSRITEAENNLKDWIIKHLKEKGSLPFSWESGNDEAFVTFKDAANTSGDEEAKFFDMEQYMIDKLDIPDAGEFQMNGNGTITIDNNNAIVKYSSTVKMLLDFNEETEEEIYSEEEKESGEKILFSL